MLTCSSDIIIYNVATYENFGGENIGEWVTCTCIAQYIASIPSHMFIAMYSCIDQDALS